MAAFQVVQVDGGDNDVFLATCVTYEDALSKVVEIAKGRDGFLRSSWHADAWHMYDPVSNRNKYLLTVEQVPGQVV